MDDALEADDGEEPGAESSQPGQEEDGEGEQGLPARRLRQAPRQAAARPGAAVERRRGVGGGSVLVVGGRVLRHVVPGAPSQPLPPPGACGEEEAEEGRGGGRKGRGRGARQGAGRSPPVPARRCSLPPRRLLAHPGSAAAPSSRRRHHPPGLGGARRGAREPGGRGHGTAGAGPGSRRGGARDGPGSARGSGGSAGLGRGPGRERAADGSGRDGRARIASPFLTPSRAGGLTLPPLRSGRSYGGRAGLPGEGEGPPPCGSTRPTGTAPTACHGATGI